jgi:hypothetical protein
VAREKKLLDRSDASVGVSEVSLNGKERAMFASLFDLILGYVVLVFFTVVSLISVAIVLGLRFLRRNDEARKVAEGYARIVASKAAKKWLKF